jgi:hypothetical protein
MSNDDLKPLAKPVDWDELYDGAFLKAGELKGKKFTLTIKSVDLYELEGAKGAQKRGVLAFKETPKLVALNKINGICLKAMFGRLVQQWEGKRVTIFPDVVKEAGAMQGDLCIRIWGSPELAHDLDVTIQLRKRKPYSLTMHKVTAGTKAAPTTPATEPRQPGDDDR